MRIEMEGQVLTSLEGEEKQEELSLLDAVKLGAEDSIFFSRTFFSKTVRQRSPDFHEEVWGLLDDQDNRLVNIQVFRGGAKTSILRMFAAKRIAYGLARTILYVGKSESHAIRSVRWLKNQVLRNRLYAETFQLSQGSKWQDVEAEINHGVDDYKIWIMATGITGSTRGINQDDFRPDLIIIDDVIDEENSATVDQRIKIEALIYGALKESLAPTSEMPDAKLAMLQTPLNREDASTKALRDPEWTSAKFGCWTARTENLELQQQESSWVDRWPSAVLRKEKAAAIHRNQLSIWLREKECKIVSPETSAFKMGWLEYYDILPEHVTYLMAIDPVPPPTDIQIAKGLRGKDYEAFAVVAVYAGEYYLVEYIYNRGHEPNWTIATFFSLCLKYHPREIIVETVAYQKTLAWILKVAMEARGQYFVIKDYDDKRSKFNKIVDALSGPASNGKFFVKREHSEFIQQFTEYPDVSNEDILEAVAICVGSVDGNAMYEDDSEAYKQLMAEEKALPKMERVGGAP